MSQDESETQEVETTTPPAPEETNKEEISAEGTAPVASAEEQTIDYKAELEKVQKQLTQAEYTIVQEKQKNKVQPEEAVEPAYEGEVTAEQLTKTIEERVQKQLDEREQSLRAELSKDVVEDVVKSLSTNPDEQELIRFHYQHSVVKSGITRQAILSDLENAKAIANKKRLERENAELVEALKAKNSVGKASPGSNQDSQVPDDEPNLTPQERDLIKRLAAKQGISMKEYIRRNKNRLTNPQ